jgi:hypothetical protein
VSEPSAQGWSGWAWGPPPVLDGVPGLAVGGAVHRAVQDRLHRQRQFERVREDLAGLAQPQARAGQQDVERALGGGQAARGAFDLGGALVGQTGAGERAADDAVAVALGLAVAQQDEFGLDHGVLPEAGCAGRGAYG